MISRPRVMVSSVVGGFEQEREAAKQAIIAAGGDPVLVNEDQSSQPKSSRNVCLDSVASSDVYICIIGERGGFVAPSGKLVVEEEYEEAKTRKIPVLLFVKAGHHDDSAVGLLSKLQDYVSGFFRKEFSSTSELQGQIYDSLVSVFSTIRMQVTNPDVLLSELQGHIGDRYTPFLRVVFAPERLETVVDPRMLGRGELVDQVLEIAHSRKVGLLSFADGTEKGMSNGWATVTKISVGQRGEVRTVLRVSEEGWLVVTTALRTEIEGDSVGFGASMVLAKEAIEDAFQKSFTFAKEYYDLIDPHRRHVLLIWNAALLHLGMRRIESKPRATNSWPGRFGSSDEPMLAFARVQRLTRDDLAHPADEIDKAVYKFEVAANELG